MPSSDSIPFPPPPVKLRSYSDADREACKSLYVDGLVGGKLADNDTGFDIDDISHAYLNSDGSHFWVAENERGEVVGMIGVQEHDEGVGEIRRLRVRVDSRRRGIGTSLVERALQFCVERGYLKVTLDTFMDREPAIKLFEKFRFKHSRTKKVGQKDLLYFYLDLYTKEEQHHPT
jgi:ribosomal protein S18 acetylase RimI-like enzyme